MEWKEVTAKTVDEALTNVMLELGTTIENIEYEIIEKETSGFLGIFGKPAKIKARIKMTTENTTKKFLDDVFRAMGITATAVVTFDKENSTIEINIDGDEMGVLIGKRGQTLDSLQYLVSLVVNKNSENYIKVKLDTENYRARRKETLENLAKNIAFKVKRTRKPVSLEPMNPYERRIIHSALQNDKYVETYSEGEEPYRKVVINIKKSLRDNKFTNNKPAGSYRKDFSKDGNSNNNSSSNNSSSNNSSSNNYRDNSKGYKKPFNTSKSPYNKNYSTDYKKDYEKYKESKEKKEQPAETV
jgi:spoIIIJ-associated protein